MRAYLFWVAGLAYVAAACGDGDPDGIFNAEEWAVKATVEDEALVIEATLATIHGNDFTHMSIRKAGWDNAYDVARSPSPEQPDRDWSRVHRWFGELHPNTYLEGSFHDGSFGKPPTDFDTYAYRLALDPQARTNWPDEAGSGYQYITRGYSYADNNPGHPGFGPGEYEIEIYAWYTGSADDLHPAAGGQSGVQYIHYERRVATTRFTIE